jgi:hypothetical protein
MQLDEKQSIQLHALFDEHPFVLCRILLKIDVHAWMSSRNVAGCIRCFYPNFASQSLPSSSTASLSGLVNLTQLAAISHSVPQLAYGNTTSAFLILPPLPTSLTLSSNLSSNSSQFLSHICCGLGSTSTTYRSLSPCILAMMNHPRSQFDVSSRYAMRFEGPRRRYGSARITQRRRKVRIELTRGCGSEEGR